MAEIESGSRSASEDEDEMPELEGKCVVCNTGTVLRCQGCVNGGIPVNDVPFYCCKEHQVKHWKAGHKLSCGANNTPKTTGWKETQAAGVHYGLPHYIATEKLEPGHKLFTKKPLLVFPRVAGREDRAIWCAQLTQLAKESLNGQKLWTCLSCYEMMIYGELIQDPLHGLKLNKCTSCGWPVHSNIIPGQPPSDCQDAHVAECQILTKNGVTWDAMKSEKNGAYYCLALLRAVLLPPKLKKMLMNLPVFCRDNFKIIESTGQAIDFVRRRCKLADLASEEELKEMFLIMFCNLLGPPGLFQSIRKKMAFTIYQGGSTGRILPHDCSPNCEAYVDRNTFSATFKTIRKVDAGEPLTISYIGGSYFKPINERMVEFTHLFLENHKCRRCSGRTEGDTYLSAIKCPVNKKSKQNQSCEYLLPILNPKPKPGLSDIFVWRCICGSCPAVMDQQTVELLTGMITAQIERAAGGSDYHQLKSIVISNSGKTVHPNHSTMIYANMNIAALAAKNVRNLNVYRDPGFQFNLHLNFVSDFEKAIEIHNTILPGRNDEFGHFLFCRTLLKMSELAQKTMRKFNNTDTIAKDLDQEVGSMIENLKECWIIFKDNTVLEPINLTRDSKLEKLYANHLAAALKQNMKTKASELPNFKLLCDKYCAEHVNLDMEEWELQKRKWTIIPQSEIPKLMETIVGCAK